MIILANNNPTKIHIIGSVGSGKTTLARNLSTKLNIPFFELDNVVWKRFKSGDIRRSEDERDEYLNRIIHSDAWIIEGIHYQWVQQGFQNADLIIFLDTAYSKRIYRIIKRFILQKTGIEKANYKPTLKIFINMFKWNSCFENENKPEIFDLLNKYNDKVIFLKDNSEIDKYFNK
ncbi:AAA family ATPase [Bacillus sp. 03113]|uniref:AAA family ATPase n=1 Tax=Bacillus sp. 03113 TaxID=2578211 RepID=UPI0011445337|nr:AAA family ATPase [Bacillus sp. 03113]